MLVAFLSCRSTWEERLQEAAFDNSELPDIRPIVRTVRRNLFHRRAISLPSPGRLVFEVAIPEAGRLDLALSVEEKDVPVTFRVLAGGIDDDPSLLLEETYDSTAGWSPHHVDLSHLGSDPARVVLETRSESIGAEGLWGSPTIVGGTVGELPNVVLYVIDAAGWDYMSLYDHERRTTPFLEELAQQGTVFNYAFFANLLQWGNAAGFNNAFQVAFGDSGVVVADGTILIPGQEYPRSGFFGHSIILGPASKIVPTDGYLDYRSVFVSAGRLDGLNGIGHAGEWGGAEAMAALLADDLLDFIEVFTFRTPDYELWYEALEAGYKLTPTAGSDYPCGGGGVPPGSPRFYAQVAGELTPSSWRSALSEGRSFVTNGPVLSLSVDGHGMGEEL